MEAKFIPGPWRVGAKETADSGGFRSLSIETRNVRHGTYRLGDDGTPILTPANGQHVADVMYHDTPPDVARATTQLIAAATELYAACVAAEEFITNGVEFGYIRMPDPDTTDSALQTLPLIEAALASARGER